MTDFLTRLIERSRGEAPTVRPLIGSMHSPGRLLPVVDGPPDGDVEQIDEIDAPPGVRTEERPAPARVFNPKASPDEAEPQSRPLGGSAAPRPEGARGVADLREALPQGPVIAGDDRQAPVEPRSPRARSASRSDAPNGRELPGARAAPMSDRPDAPPARPDIAAQLERRLSAVIEAQARTERRPPLRTVEPRPSRSDPPLRTTPGEGRPTVRVTIGRVEVRAVPPPAPPPPSKPAGPKVSLDQYLQSRKRADR